MRLKNLTYEDLEKQIIEPLNTPELIRLYVLVNKKYEKLKEETPRFNIVKYNAIHAEKLNKKQKERYKNKKESIVRD